MSTPTREHDLGADVTVEPGGWWISPVGEGSDAALTGEFDLVNRRELETALLQLVAHGSDVRLDMAGVLFADVGAGTTLALAAQSLPPRRRLVLHRPPPAVRRVLDLCWPGLDRVEVTD